MRYLLKWSASALGETPADPVTHYVARSDDREKIIEHAHLLAHRAFEEQPEGDVDVDWIGQDDHPDGHVTFSFGAENEILIVYEVMDLEAVPAV